MKHLTIALMAVMLFTALCSFAQRRGHSLTFHSSYSRVRYSGSHHTVSRGGHYGGGRGSSHKDGSYRDVRTNNHYGSHK